MISYFQAIVLGLVQGITELFPISSLGHSVIIPRLLHWNINLADNSFLVFIVVTHFATSLVLLGFFWSDWVKIVKGIFHSIAIREIKETDVHAKLGWLIVVATIPAGILGLLFEEKFKMLFASAGVVSVVLILNGFLLYGTEILRKRVKKQEHSFSDQRIAKLSWTQSVKIGLMQCLALIPGFSRTGSALGGGLLVGLSHEDSARFGFLLATPIIFAAAVLKIPDLFQSGNSIIVGQTIVGALCSALAAYFSIRFLTKYFETKTLNPFAVYCVVAGIVSLVLLHIH